MAKIRLPRLGESQVTDQVDIVRTAKVLVECYGDAAQCHAVMRINELTESGDFAALDVWRRILQAVAELTKHGAPPNRTVH